MKKLLLLLLVICSVSFAEPESLLDITFTAPSNGDHFLLWENGAKIPNREVTISWTVTTTLQSSLWKVRAWIGSTEYSIPQNATQLTVRLGAGTYTPVVKLYYFNAYQAQWFYLKDATPSTTFYVDEVFTAAFALNFDYGSMTVNSDPRVDPNSYLFFRYGNASQSKFMGPAGDYSISAPEIQTDPQGHQRKFDRWTNEYSTGIGSSPSLTATISSNTNLFKANYYEIPTTPSIKPLVSSTGVDGGPVKVSWNPSLGPVTYYEVSRKIDNYPGVWEVVTTATSTFWIDATAFYCPVGGQFGASYRVRAYGAGYWSNYSDVASERVEDGGFSNMKMGNEEFGQMGEESALVTSYALNQNYPNPFNPSTTISYAVPQDGNVTLKVYDMAGHEVASLVDGYKSAGRYSVKFDAAKLSSGIYIYKIQAGSYSAMKKMQLVK